MNRMITDEDFIPKRPNSRKVTLLLICVLPIAVALFMMDGRWIVERIGAEFGIMSDSLVEDMLSNIEYNYYYEDVFDTDTYRQLRADLTDRPLKTYRDFEDYVYGLSELSGDEYTYFYYDSLTDSRTDYSEVNDYDYVDDFSTFEKEGITVIQFHQFAYQTGERVVDALKKIQKEGKRVVVFDLTDNPGGMIDQCVQMCDSLLPGTVIFEEEYNDLSRYQYVSDPQMMNFDKIVILLNGESASCSEIMALTLKEHLKDKVLLVGSETYGKKVTQSVDQDDRLHYSLYLVTAKWSVNGKTTDDLNGYLIPWRKKNLKGFEDTFREAHAVIDGEGLIP